MTTVKHRHSAVYHLHYGECADCGAQRYRTYPSGHGPWHLNGSPQQWCPGKPAPQEA